ncbi:clumping factor A-like [Macrosteles quadrilineatus]|uniref:clumping factor A-like n=1 Tax=Macrosteles quadrilineatus TaxID=74068 RepID=UPI0023E1175B|nr:clumping factor A-like [Macrosteles quadrilineatus]
MRRKASTVSSGEQQLGDRGFRGEGDRVIETADPHGTCNNLEYERDALMTAKPGNAPALMSCPASDETSAETVSTTNSTRGMLNVDVTENYELAARESTTNAEPLNSNNNFKNDSKTDPTLIFATTSSACGMLYVQKTENHKPTDNHSTSIVKPLDSDNDSNIDSDNDSDIYCDTVSILTFNTTNSSSEMLYFDVTEHYEPTANISTILGPLDSENDSDNDSNIYCDPVPILTFATTNSSSEMLYFDVTEHYEPTANISTILRPLDSENDSDNDSNIYRDPVPILTFATTNCSSGMLYVDVTENDEPTANTSTIIVKPLESDNDSDSYSDTVPTLTFTNTNFNSEMPYVDITKNNEATDKKSTTNAKPLNFSNYPKDPSDTVPNLLFTTTSSGCEIPYIDDDENEESSADTSTITAELLDPNDVSDTVLALIFATTWATTRGMLYVDVTGNDEPAARASKITPESLYPSNDCDTVPTLILATTTSTSETSCVDVTKNDEPTANASTITAQHLDSNNASDVVSTLHLTTSNSASEMPCVDVIENDESTARASAITETFDSDKECDMLLNPSLDTSNQKQHSSETCYKHINNNNNPASTTPTNTLDFNNKRVSEDTRGQPVYYEHPVSACDINFAVTTSESGRKLTNPG